jgi:hypothetical protein
VVPLAGVACVGYTIHENVVGVAFPYDRFACIAGAYLVVGLAIVAFAPGLADRVTSGLRRSTQDPAGPPSLP